jgi:anti-sigma-K factor RskA
MIPLETTDRFDRFDELSAGWALGDLTPQEEQEWAARSREMGVSPDFTLDLLAASLEIESLQNALQQPPAALLARLHRHAAASAAPGFPPTNLLQPDVPAWRKWVGNPLLGWAAAAAIALSAVLNLQPAAKISPAPSVAQLRSQAGDLIERPFSGVGTYTAASGTVIWSDRLQQGYMTLAGLPVNDPSQAQYQLWIVDPKRDEAPVDGGVFNIPRDGSALDIPIAAKLALSQPQAFVITLEQPGGVVKSKQEKVVALAKL